MVKDTKKPVKRRKKRPNLKHGAYSYLTKANMYIMPTTQLHMCDPCPLKKHCDYYEPGASCKIIDTFTPARLNTCKSLHQQTTALRENIKFSAVILDSVL